MKNPVISTLWICDVPIWSFDWKIRNFFHYRHNQQLEELNVQHQEEIDRLQEQLRRERARGHEDRLHYENEANQVRRIAQERAAAEIERIREEEETKRKVLAKKHAVSEFRHSVENWEFYVKSKLEAFEPQMVYGVIFFWKNDFT